MLNDILKHKVRIENGTVRFPMNRFLPLLLAGVAAYLFYRMLSGDLMISGRHSDVPTILVAIAYLFLTAMCTENVELTPRHIIVRYLGIRWKNVWWSQIGCANLVADEGKRGISYSLRLYYDRTTEDELRIGNADTSPMQSDGYISLNIPTDQLEEVVEAINALLPEHIDPIKIPEM